MKGPPSHGGEYRLVNESLGHSVDLVDIPRIQGWVSDERDPLDPRHFARKGSNEIGSGSDRIAYAARLCGHAECGPLHLTCVGARLLCCDFRSVEQHGTG